MLAHGGGLIFQGLRRSSIFLNQRRILLGRLVHLRQRPVDLVDAARLLGAGICDVGDDARHAIN